MDLGIGRGIGILISGGSPSSFFCFSFSFFFCFFFCFGNLGILQSFPPPHGVFTHSEILGNPRSFSPSPIFVGGVRDARLAVPHKVVEFSFFFVISPLPSLYIFFFSVLDFYPLSFWGVLFEIFLNGALSSSSVN